MDVEPAEWHGLKKDLKAEGKNEFKKSEDDAGRIMTTMKPDSWACTTCTFEHIGASKQLFLFCELCVTPRSSSGREEKIKIPTQKPKQNLDIAMPSSLNKRKNISSLSPGSFSQHDKKEPSAPMNMNPPPMAVSSRTTTCASSSSVPSGATSSSAWGSLRPPSAKDICGPGGKRQKGLDKPVPLMDYLIVLDFEWTADNKAKMMPIAEITQFPSVCMKLVERNSKSLRHGTDMQQAEQENSRSNDIILPVDLTRPCDWSARQDAYAVSAFDTFVKPTYNPKLTKFSIELTAITQEQVDNAPTVDVALKNYVCWLSSLDLVDPVSGNKKGNWCFVTWGDGDIMSTLREELQHKSIELPSCFDRWINLKSDSMFKKHYGREPRGGLRSCVESVGATWEGRAHNGLIDSFNTAKIVRHMVQTGFRFTRPTRGLGKDGVPFGQKRSNSR